MLHFLNIHILELLDNCLYDVDHLPAAIKPLQSAVAIRPAPINPTFIFNPLQMRWQLRADVIRSHVHLGQVMSENRPITTLPAANSPTGVWAAPVDIL